MITASNYKETADNINELLLLDDYSLTILDDLDSYLSDLSDEDNWINSLGQVDSVSLSTIDLLESELDNNITGRVSQGYGTKDLITALQNHVYIQYGSVNDFLSDNAIKIKSRFAAESAKYGYTINPGNIES